MSGTKQKIAVGISSAALTVGLFGAFEPPSHSTNAQQRQAAQSQQESNNLAHAQENQNARYREAGLAQADAENARSLIPGEYRPPEVPDLRLRILP
jgi:hypothetical protein